jgi:hypothetical protein
MQLTDWLLVEVVLLLMGLTKNSWTKSSFDTPSVIESPLRLRALALYEGNAFKDERRLGDSERCWSTDQGCVLMSSSQWVRDRTEGVDLTRTPEII